MEKAVSLPSSLQIQLVKQTKWFLIFLYNSLKTQLKLTVFKSNWSNYQSTLHASDKPEPPPGKINVKPGLNSRVCTTQGAAHDLEVEK